MCGGLTTGKKDTIKLLVKKWKPDVLCLQETKFEETVMATQIWGSRWVDWVELKSCRRNRGITIFWGKRQWNHIGFPQGTYSINAMFKALQGERSQMVLYWCIWATFKLRKN